MGKERLRGAAIGVALAQGAPLGLAVIRALIPHEGNGPLDDVANDPALYVYLVLSTSVVLGLAGAWVGGRLAQLRAAGNEDPLTRLANLRAFEARLVEETRRAERYDKPLTLLMIDVDRLKQLNDGEGHAAGDRALCEVARAIRTGVRAVDLAARVGGDEFAVILPETSVADGAVVAERIRGATPSRVTVSIGVAGGARESLRARADRALYEAKHAGRDRVSIASE